MSAAASTTTGAPVPARTLAQPRGLRGVKDKLATLLVWTAFGVALVPLVWILWTVVSKGIGPVLEPSWWGHSQRGVTFRMTGGGAYHAVLGTLLQALLASAISVPVGILTAVYLVEYGRGKFARTVTFMVDILTGVPSIVAALFVYAAFVTLIGANRAGWLVSLALVLLMIPVIVRSTEEMLKLVPDELREGAYALGIPKWRTIMRVVVPTAFNGIATGVMLGLARVMGETAPLLILVVYSPAINFDLFDGPQAALPTMIKDGATAPPGSPGFDRLWAAALTLVLLVLILNLIARGLSRLGAVREK
jgi:phosphate transport system permease protein